MTTKIEKCPTCGADAINRSEFWEAAPENGDELQLKIFAIEKAIKKYYLALDRRQHGGVSQNKAFNEIEQALGVYWQQGGMIKEITENPNLAKIYDA